MNPAVWAGPVVLTLWLAALSLYTRRRWVVLYFLAGFFGFAAGLLLDFWSETAARVWWAFWAAYAFTLPALRAMVPHWWEKRPSDAT